MTAYDPEQDRPMIKALELGRRQQNALELDLSMMAPIMLLASVAIVAGIFPGFLIRYFEKVAEVLF
jgi:hypothetical protein